MSLDHSFTLFIGYLGETLSSINFWFCSTSLCPNLMKASVL